MQCIAFVLLADFLVVPSVVGLTGCTGSAWQALRVKAVNIAVVDNKRLIICGGYPRKLVNLVRLNYSPLTDYKLVTKR